MGIVRFLALCMSRRFAAAFVLGVSLTAAGTVQAQQPAAAEAKDTPDPVPSTPGPTGDAPEAASEQGPASEADVVASEEPPKEAGTATDAVTTDASSTKPQDLRDEIDGKDTTGTPVGPPEQPSLPAPSAPAGQKRPLPDYDGRGDGPSDAGDVLVWIPRTVFYPVHLVLNWGVRWPLVRAVTVVEQYHLAERVNDFFTWDDGNAGVYPGFNVDFGVRAHAGFQFFWTRLFWHTDIKASAFAGVGDLWYLRAGTDSHVFRDESGRFSLRGSYVRRPDNPYYGIGDLHSVECSRGGDPCRYRSAIGEVMAELGGYPEHLNRTVLEVGYRHARFSREEADAPTVTDSQVAEIPGFLAGYSLLHAGLSFAGDTRGESVEFEHGSGARLEGWGYFNFDPAFIDTRFVQWGAEGSGFWDFGHGQTLGARLYVDNVENAGEPLPSGDLTPIPFTELVGLGGAETMRGFLERRMIGHRAWASTLQYRYPVLAFLDANLFFSIGNAFDRLEDFDIEKNFLSYGLSFKTSGSRTEALEMLLGFGSNRLDSDEFRPVDTVRFTFGINNGF